LEFNERFDQRFTELFTEGVEEYTREYQFGKQWGWYHSIYSLAKGDIRRFDEITKISAAQCLTFLTYEKQKTEIEIAKTKK
jgi:hypothetical protein